MASFFGIDGWLKKPADRDVIACWTAGGGEERLHALALPQPSEEAALEFLALGDSGDSETAAHGLSPQDAVARAMAAECAPPVGHGSASLVLHLGDVVYMTGERRLYDRNFRRPYSDFLTPESTAESLTFRIPFLPIPGNHDYYDLGGWAMWLARAPILGAGIRTLTRQLFAFHMPEGGSDMGRAYMEAFVDLQADTSVEPLDYRPGERTLLPNRYYRFRLGPADFFALDSNTLDAPAPWTDTGPIREGARRTIEQLEKRARQIDRRLRSAQAECDRWQTERRARDARNETSRALLAVRAQETAEALGALENALKQLPEQDPDQREAEARTQSAAMRWSAALRDLRLARDPGDAVEALEEMDEAAESSWGALRATESCLTHLPEGAHRTLLLTARDQAEAALDAWEQGLEPMPPSLCTELEALSEEALDIERDLALERRRARYRPEDHDAAQLRWLDRALAESVRDRPEAWRIVYLHHPLYTTIANHCEKSDIRAVRENLLAILRDRAHLVLSGHAHAFEWIRSRDLPNTGLFVTGGGGQVSLRPSLLDPARRRGRPSTFQRLAESGAVEAAAAGHGPYLPGTTPGPLYHFLQIRAEKDRIVVRPIGIRRVPGGFRRESPIPVFHIADLASVRPAARVRMMERVEVYRGRPPASGWA